MIRRPATTLTLPTSWEACTPAARMLLYTLMVRKDVQPEDAAALLAAHYARKQQTMQLTPDTLAAAIRVLDWVGETPQNPVPLPTVDDTDPCNEYLHGVHFRDYLQLENYYQGYLISREPEALHLAIGIVYGRTIEWVQRWPWLVPAFIVWYAGLKAWQAREYPHLFRPSQAGAEPPDMRAIMQAQIRALTAGDVTKTDAVLAAMTNDALAELDAKAREAQELDKLYKNK